MVKSLSGFIAGPVGVILVLFFFLPWVTISCAGSFDIAASGMDLATGNALDEFEEQVTSLSDGLTDGLTSDFGEFDDGSSGSIDFGSDDTSISDAETDTALDADPLIWLILIAAVATAAIAGARLFMPMMSEMRLLSGISYVALGLIALSVQVVKYFDLQDLKSDIETQQAAEGFTFITMSYSAWWWLTMFGLFAIVVAGLIAILLEDQLPVQPQAATSSLNLPPVPATILAECSSR